MIMNPEQFVLAEICQKMSDDFVKSLEKIYNDYCKKNQPGEVTPMLPVAVAQAAGWILSSWATATNYPRPQLWKEFEAMFKEAAKNQLEWHKGEKTKIN